MSDSVDSTGNVHPIGEKSKIEVNASANEPKLRKKQLKQPTEEPPQPPQDTQGEGDDDLPFPLKQRHIVNALQRKTSIVKAFPDAFRVYRKESGEDQDGGLQVIEVDPATRVCKKTSLAAVARAIANHLEGVKGFCLTDQQIEATAKLWLKLVPISKEPKPYLFKGDKGPFKGDKKQLCFRRVCWDPDISVPYPTWKKIFPPTMIGYKCFMAYIGSIFDYDSYNQQFLVVKGEGGDGKGALIRFLERIMGPTATRVISRTPTDDNKHGGTYFSGGKRLVAFSDLRRPVFLQSDLVMGISGGDTLYVDPKGVEGYNTRPNLKMIAMINCKLIVPKQRSYRRRYIPTEIPFKDATDMKLTNTFEDTLWKEGPGFLAACLEAYHEMCPNGDEMIQVPKEVWDHFDQGPATEEDAEIEEKFDLYFNVQPPDTPKEHQSYVVTASFTKHFLELEWGKKKTLHARVKKWLKEKHGIELKQHWDKALKENIGSVYMRLSFK